MEEVTCTSKKHGICCEVFFEVKNLIFSRYACGNTVTTDTTKPFRGFGLCRGVGNWTGSLNDLGWQNHVVTVYDFFWLKNLREKRTNFRLGILMLLLMLEIIFMELEFLSDVTEKESLTDALAPDGVQECGPLTGIPFLRLMEFHDLWLFTTFKI